MEHPQHHQVGAIVSILEDVLTAEHLQDKLSILFAAGDGPAEARIAAEDLRSRAIRFATA